MAGITLNVLGNFRDFIRGTQDADNALDDVSDALDDVAKDAVKDGQKAGDAIDDGISDGSKEASKSLERLEASFRDLTDTAKKETDQAGDAAKKNLGKGGVASESISGFKDEAIQNFSEVASSFDGSAQGIADGIQGTFGGLATALPLPLGIAAGAIGAIGGAIATDWAKHSEEMEQAASDWADAYIEAGNRILSSSQIVGKVQEITTDPELYKKAQENAKNWGTSVGLAMLAMAGDANALAEAQQGLNKKTNEMNALTQTSATRYADGRQKLSDMSTEIRNGQGALDDINGSMAIGAQRADAYSESLRLTAENTAGATVKTDEFGDAVYTLPDGKQIYIDAETGQATDNVDSIEKRVYGLPNSKTIHVGVDFRGFDEAERRLANLARDRTVTVNVRGDITRIGNQVW
jgi:hypothetical protein